MKEATSELCLKGRAGILWLEKAWEEVTAAETREQNARKEEDNEQ